MRPLSTNDIEAELSYAYIHAVASKAGVGCKLGSRHDDNAGIDAELTGWGPFPGGGYRQEIDIKVQLKATVKQPIESEDKFWSYSLAGISRYDDLRSEAISTPRILVVLFLPESSKEWLSLNEDALTLRKCAYWVSLRGAKPSNNTSAQTIYLPKANRFDPEGLMALMASLSHNKVPQYSEVIK
ncbi:DUF4365 domain-containing protein [Methylomonas fluvii]|uniref:DUF4365 domain-containing protein n=1 Tax=Methylomonas fluvii TaxID=1854564 RepID=A0ABR9D992_9GAMM|nr:DUF4365 domain-containing protein [Methylomonas fluvii]MBD9359682.1 DUF4365 domain-containing protein [Methylomonas fluvii]CAD6872432.1 hypothetical protein [Methylomonas fluvii]